MASPKHSATLGGNLLGALNGAASCVTITVASATLVFAPLGPEWLAQGVVACLIAAIVGGLVAALIGSAPVSISSPRAAASVVLAALVSNLVAHMPNGSPVVVVALACTAVVLAGALQAVAGLARLGQLVRFVPFPVIAGFTHGIALLLLVVYIPVLLGITAVPRLQIGRWDAMVPGALLLGIATIALILLCSRPKLRLPALFVGLVAGIGLHWALGAVAPDFATGPLLDLHALPRPVLPQEEWMGLAAALAEPAIWGHIVSFSMALAVVSSVDSLVGVMVIETRYGVRSQPDRDLLAQGFANAASGALGGSALSFAAVQVQAAYSAGARNWLASIVAPLFVLALAGLAAYGHVAIPLAVLAGLMIIVAIRLADPWAFALLRTAWRTRGAMEPIVRNSVLVYALVATSVIALGIVTALAVGVTVAAIMFLRTMNRHVLRRTLVGNSVRSRRLFPPAVADVIAARMEAVAVMEVQGPLFFGTSDRIVEEVARLPATTRYVVLDMGRVQALDETAVAVLMRLAARLGSEKRQFVICGRPPGLTPVDGNLPRAFPDRDRAIEWIEERLLEEAGIPVPREEVEAGALARMLQLDERGEQALRRHCPVVEHAAGSTIFRAGDPSDELYFLLSGRVSIMHIAHATRVVTFLPGNVFGDVAFVDGKPRSADAVCDLDSRLLVLDRATLARIEAEAPTLVARLYAALAHDIAGRLRATDRIVRDIL